MNNIAFLEGDPAESVFGLLADAAPILQVGCIHCRRTTYTDLRVLYLIHGRSLSGRQVRRALRCRDCGSPAVRIRKAIGSGARGIANQSPQIVGRPGVATALTLQHRLRRVPSFSTEIFDR